MICKILKLVNGDTIIGNITEETRLYIDIHRPIQVALIQKTPGVYGIGLHKWDSISRDDLPSRIFKQSIISVSDPAEDFLKSYTDIYRSYDKQDEESSLDWEDDDKKEVIADIEESLEEILKAFERVGASNTNHTLH